MKEKYLLDVGRAMFWHFGAKEIRETLRELSEFFDLAAEDGLSEEQVIMQYGDAKQFAAGLRGKRDPVENKRRRSVAVKIFGLMGLMLAIWIVAGTFSVSATAAGITILGPAFVWLCSGSNSLLEIVTVTEKKKRIYYKLQTAVVLLYTVFQFFTGWVIPNSITFKIVMEHPVLFGRGITILIYCSMAVTVCIIIYAFRAMQRGNIIMFFIIIQGIALVGGLLVYNDFLRRFSTGDIRFLLWPYPLGALAAACWRLVLHRRIKVRK